MKKPRKPKTERFVQRVLQRDDRLPVARDKDGKIIAAKNKPTLEFSREQWNCGCLVQPCRPNSA